MYGLSMLVRLRRNIARQSLSPFELSGYSIYRLKQATLEPASELERL
jgi:hypothetical protein